MCFFYCFLSCDKIHLICYQFNIKQVEKSTKTFIGGIVIGAMVGGLIAGWLIAVNLIMANWIINTFS